MFGFEGQRDSSTLLIYNNGNASVIEEVKIKGKFTKSIKRGTNNNNNEYEINDTLIINGLSEYIDRESLFIDTLGDQFNIKVKDFELHNPKSTTDYFKFLKDQEIRITDLTPSITDPKIFSGKLIDNRSDTIVLSNAQNTHILNLPRVNMLTLKEYPFDIINPYIVANIIMKGNDTSVKLLYDTNSISYRTNYLFNVNENKNTMDFILKATINNDTSSDFKNATIKLIEKSEKKVEKNIKQYKQYKENMALYATRSIPKQSLSISNLDKDVSDTSQEQKTFKINDIVSINKNSSKNITMLEVIDVKGKIEYIYEPQSDSENIKMNLSWPNTKENNKNLGFLLPIGNVTVWRKSDESGPMKLGESMITNYLSKKKNIRIDLGNTSAIYGNFEDKGDTKDEIAGTRTYNYLITLTNTTNNDIDIIIKFNFPKTDWKVEGDLIFTPWEPENTGEPFVKSIGKSIIKVNSKTKLKSGFRAIVFI
jgi:hypothetical protein